MKVFRQISKVFVAALLMTVSVLTSFSPVMAEDVPEYRLQISPYNLTINDLKPGQVETGEFKVQNTGKQAFRFKVGITPYTVIDKEYTPNYDDQGVYNDIVDWVTFSQEEGKLESNGEIEIHFTIKVPKDVPAGGQYAMLYAQIISDNDTPSTAGINMESRAGLILYSNVDGVTRKTGTILENKIPSILFNPPVIGESLVSNTGNIHANARYVLQVYPLFSDEEVFTNEENPDVRTVLPETQRFNTVTWAGAPHLGIFRVKQTIYLFGEVSTTEKIVFLCPIWFLFIILLIIFCAIFWIVTRVRSRRQ